MTTIEQTRTVDSAALEALWQPVRAGDLQLPHRLAMAPMTRSRSRQNGTPSPMNASYYAQRASTALIITEGTQPSEDGQGHLSTPAATATNTSPAGGLSPTLSTKPVGAS